MIEGDDLNLPDVPTPASMVVLIDEAISQTKAAIAEYQLYVQQQKKRLTHLQKLSEIAQRASN